MSNEPQLKRMVLLSATLLCAPLLTAQAQTDEQQTCKGEKDKLHVYLLIGRSNMAGRSAN